MNRHEKEKKFIKRAERLIDELEQVGIGMEFQTDLRIFTENVEEKALAQIQTLVNQPAFRDCKVRIMPDVHAGAGCVIGFTANLGDKVIPNIVGVDIGCGMLTIAIGNIEIDYGKLDGVIRRFVPSGRNVHDGNGIVFDGIKDLLCYKRLRNVEWIEQSLGTLGGGNHFIEVDADENGNKCLVIHTGSRNLGKQVAEYYQNLAIENMFGKKHIRELELQIVKEYKETGRSSDIEAALKELNRKHNRNPYNVPKELCYLTGQDREDYLHDMRICQEFAEKNRRTIADTIISKMGFREEASFETIHNYIEIETNMVRKGAISAKNDELLLIPINMRDGCIIGRGKGNPDWNYSAPHGAGRIMSRNKAKEAITLDQFEKSMDGIFTTSVSTETIDESPMAYKPMDEILRNIGDTVSVEKIIKPVYNFKASE